MGSSFLHCTEFACKWTFYFLYSSSLRGNNMTPLQTLLCNDLRWTESSLKLCHLCTAIKTWSIFPPHLSSEQIQNTHVNPAFDFWSVFAHWAVTNMSKLNSNDVWQICPIELDGNHLFNCSLAFRHTDLHINMHAETHTRHEITCTSTGNTPAQWLTLLWAGVLPQQRHNISWQHV